MTRQVYAIVLAAGHAARFGSTKQLAAIGDRTMVARAIEAATDACGDRTLVVVGHQSAEVARACEGLPGFLHVNEAHADGIGTSIAAAVQGIRHLADAVLVVLADQPLVTGAHLSALVTAWSGSPNEIVATAFSDTNGPPVLFASACFDDLADLQGDNGGRRLLSDARFSLKRIECDAAAIDIDTVDDLESLRGAQ